MSKKNDLSSDTRLVFARTFQRAGIRRRHNELLEEERGDETVMNIAKALAVSAVAGMLIGGAVACGGGGNASPGATDPSAGGGKSSCSAGGASSAAPASSGKSSCSAGGAAPKY
jgi:hypothetical protein